MDGHKSRRLIDCWCCGRHKPHAGRDLCERCYKRWLYHDFAGAGPGPEFTSQADKAAEYAHVITVLSLRQAGEKLGVSPRTVQRWRATLRAAA